MNCFPRRIRRDGSGNYLFSGYKTNVTPFVLNPSPSAGPVQHVQSLCELSGRPRAGGAVDASRLMNISEDGAKVFMRVTDESGNITNASVFDSLKNMIDTAGDADGEQSDVPV